MLLRLGDNGVIDGTVCPVRLQVSEVDHVVQLGGVVSGRCDEECLLQVEGDAVYLLLVREYLLEFLATVFWVV